MPGMMNTVLNLGLTPEATAGLAAETRNPEFARDSRLRLLSSFASAVCGFAPESPDAAAHPSAFEGTGGCPKHSRRTGVPVRW